MYNKHIIRRCAIAPEGRQPWLLYFNGNRIIVQCWTAIAKIASLSLMRLFLLVQSRMAVIAGVRGTI